jgi:hypothetical protein|nr:MAG TPA: Protein of unknown function (DUF2577) [Caudoviricetes sp.]
MSNPYTELSKIMEERGATLNGYNLEVAKVIRINPLTIRVGEVDISVNLNINPAMILNLNTDSIVTEETGLKELLKSLLNAVQIKQGDLVAVQRVGDNFYILNKVVGV